MGGARLRIAALGAVSGLAVLVGCGGGAASGGFSSAPATQPLSCGDGSASLGHPLEQVGRPFTFGLLVLHICHGKSPVYLDSANLLGRTPGLSFLGVKVLPMRVAPYIATT